MTTVCDEQTLLARAVDEQQLRTVFQPVVDLTSGDILGYEALTRGPAGSPLESPARLFAAASGLDLLAALDWTSRCVAMRNALAGGMRPPLTLFVNAEPKALGAACPAQLQNEWVRSHGRLRVVVELTERALMSAPAELIRVVMTLRELGWGVALDDVGVHPDSLALMPIIAPDVIKLDLRLLHDEPSVPSAQVMHGVAAEAERTGAVIVAEGIETTAQLETARALGATLGQGYLLGRPNPLPRHLPAPATPLRVSAMPSGLQDLTPFEVVARSRPVHEAELPMLHAVALSIVEQARGLGTPPVLLTAFDSRARLVTPLAQALAAVAQTSAFVGMVSADRLPRIRRVRPGTLQREDPFAAEWDVVLVGAHFSAAFTAVPVAGTLRSADGPRYRYAVTYDRETVLHCARALLSRIDPM